MVAKYASVGKYLKKMRSQADVSQNEVGRILGYKNGQLVSNWERGDQDAPLEALPRLIKLYNLDTRILLKLLIDDSEKRFRRLLSIKKKKQK